MTSENDGRRDRDEKVRLWSLLDALVSVSSELQLDVVLRRIVDAACDVIGARYGALGVIDEGRRGLSNFVYRGISDEERERIGRLPVGRGLLGALIDDPRPIRLESIAADRRSVGFPDNHPPMRSFLGVPVAARGVVVGNLYLTEKEGGGTFTDEDERLAIALASQAGVAVENARLFGLATANEVEARRRLRELDVVQDIGTAMLSHLEPNDVLRSIARGAVELTDATLAYVATPGETAGRLIVRAAAGTRSSGIEGREIATVETFGGFAMRSLEPVIVSDITMDHRAKDPIADDFGLRSLACAPLLERRTPVGALVLMHRDESYFRDDDLFVLRRFGSLGSMALRNAQLASADRDRALMEAQLAEAELREQLRADNMHAIIRAQEAERARIARDLHDSAGQSLTSILLTLAVTQRLGSLEDVRAHLTELRAFTGTVASDIRRIATELRPHLLDDLGLAAALERLVADIAERSGIDVVARVDLSDERLGTEVETVIYRVVQEAVNNAVKSADPSSIEVVVEDSDDVRATVRDDGRGFDCDAVPGDGLGLPGMRERAELVGGKLEITSAPGAGTTVTLRIPSPDRSAGRDP